MKAGIIGLGIGKAHLKAYLKSQDIDGICVADVNKDTLEDIKSEYGDGKISYYCDAEEMMGKENLDMISICTPPKYHRNLVKIACERQIAILCEKPMAPTIGDCEQMIRDAESAGVIFMMGFKKRFSPVYNKLKEMIDGEFGIPYSIFIRYVCGGGVNKEWFWKEDDGGGPIVENTAHVLDIIRYLVGDYNRIYGEGDNIYAAKRGIDQIDQAVFTIRSKSGTMCAVRAGAWAKGKLKQEEMFFYFNNADVHIIGPFDHANTITIARRDQKEVEKLEYSGLNDIDKEIKHFIDCVKYNKKPIATGYDGREALRASLAVKKSARSGMPIDLTSNQEG